MLAGATMEEQVRLLQQARDRREVFDQPEQVSSSRASSRNAWGGVREADGGGVLFITDPMTRRLSGLATSRDTSRASLLRRGHICRRWVSHCEPASGLPPSETVKLLFAVLLSHSRGAVQPVHSGIPVFPVFPADLFGGFRQRRVANIAGIPSRASTARPPIRQERADVGFNRRRG
jgi:hypothetical protein